MVFGKDQNASKEGKKGGIGLQKSGNSSLTKLWKTKAFRKKMKNYPTIKDNFTNKLSKKEYSEHCRIAGKQSRIRENIISKKIKPNYDNFFLPSTICDRIAIKNNKLIIIEIKKDKHDKLRTNQKKFQDLCKKIGITYKIHYYKE